MPRLRALSSEGMSGDRAHKPPLSERVLGGLGALAVAALFAFLIAEAVAEDRDPELVAGLESVEQMNDNFAVHVYVRNDGGETAVDVGLSGEITAGGRVIETSSTTVSYVPERSVRRAVLLFERDPREHEFEVAPSGYELP